MVAKITGRKLSTLLLVVTGLCFLSSADPRAQSKMPTDLELVLAVDTSSSVDQMEYELQRQGLAQAFLHQDVINAIQAVGDVGIAVTMVHWAGRSQQNTVVDWMLINDDISAAVFSTKILSVSRNTEGLTDIAGALIYSLVSIEGNEFDGQRSVIDVSGDGSGEAYRTAQARDIVVARGITVNGLVIYNDDHDLGEYANITIRDHYINHVIGGNGAFLMTADDFSDFGIAIRRKLVREIIGLNLAQIKTKTSIN